MTLEELIKALEFEGEESKGKVDILKKEFNAKQKEINNLTKTNKELTENSAKAKEVSDKFDIVVKAYGLDLEAEDFDKMLDETKDKFVKDAGGGVEPEEVKTLNRELTKTKRELEKANTQITELTTQLEGEKTLRINGVKKDAINKALIANKVIKPDQMLDLFLNKVSVDEDGTTVTMKDATGNEISINDGIADWAKDNPEFVIKETHGGFGSAGGSSGRNNNEISDFMKAVIEDRNMGNNGGEQQKSLGELFG